MNIKRVLFACLFLAGVIAAPVQGQTGPTRLVNPADSAFLPCGLPPVISRFTTSRTFEMTDDCTYGPDSNTNSDPAVLWFTAGTHIINGNGYSIEGPPSGHALWAQDSGTTVTLNNIVFRNQGGRTVVAQNSATINGNNIVFRDNSGGEAPFSVTTSATASLMNVEFLNNRQGGSGTTVGSAMYTYNGGRITITNGIFRGNRNRSGQQYVITADGTNARVTLNGCITFSGNVLADGTAATDHQGVRNGVVTDSSTGTCPAAGFSYWLALTPQKKSKKTATPWPSATARPLATTCIDLNQATGIAVSATYGLGSGIQCQRLGGGGIGFQALADSFIDAVDIWGYVNQGVEVCFPQAGELLFLDARMMPRTISPLASTVVNGMTCGAIDSPGSIVLMPHSQLR